MLDFVDRDGKVLRPQAERRPHAARETLSPEVVSGSLQVADFLAILVAGYGAFVIYLLSVVGSAEVFARYGLTAIVAATFFVFTMHKTGGYRMQRLAQFGWQLKQATIVWAATIAALTTCAFVTKVADVYSRGWAVTFAALMFVELGAGRLVLRQLVGRWRTQGRLMRSVAVVGAGQVGADIISRLKANGKEDVEIVGVFDDRSKRVPAVVAGSPVLGTIDRLISFAQTSRIDEIIIALPLRATERIGDLVGRLRLLPVDIRLSIDPIAGAFPMRGIGETASVRVINILDRPLKHWNGILKSIEDKLLSALLLAALAPIMLLIALAVRLDSGGPILFRQRRYGYNNALIVVYKFRTLRVDATDADAARLVTASDPRVTRVGNFLRRFSLDELPQLFNVLRGEMSIVGPRPHAKLAKAGGKYYDQVVNDYIARHRVKPGLTGWAQVNGWRGETESEEKIRRRVECDLFYIENWSIWLDVKIILKTLLVILQRN